MVCDSSVCGSRNKDQNKMPKLRVRLNRRSPQTVYTESKEERRKVQSSKLRGTLKWRRLVKSVCVRRGQDDVLSGTGLETDVVGWWS